MVRKAPPTAKRRTPKVRAPSTTSTFLPRSGYDSRDARRRIGPILARLESAYPGARTELRYRNPFELLVATILSAQCTDERVNRVTPNLFGRYPSPAKLARAKPADVERIIASTGFYHQKTKAIIGCSEAIVERHGGNVPQTLAELVELPGVARKTANVLLANCWPRPASDHGIFVDTHVRRVAGRLALTEHDEPERIEPDLMDLVPPEKWADFPHQLVLLGRGPCAARAPRHAACPVLDWCPTGQQALSPTAAKASSRGHRR